MAAFPSWGGRRRPRDWALACRGVCRSSARDDRRQRRSRCGRLRSSVEIVCSGTDAEDLLYAWLNAVIYEMAIRHMVFGRFDVEIGDGTVRAVAWGETLLPERHQPAVEIKGATFTGLRVRKESDEWVAECVVDV
jgi:SHS2 domain-containing protein